MKGQFILIPMQTPIIAVQWLAFCFVSGNPALKLQLEANYHD
jgi:hypothetical protein